MKVHYKKAKFHQWTYYCPYCKKDLTYIWSGKVLIGIALDKWLYCSKCKTDFKIGVYGFRQQELKKGEEK